MKEAWVRLEQWSGEMVTTALEGGADAVIVPIGCQEQVKALGRITTVSPDGDLRPGRDVAFETLTSPEDEARIAHLLARVPVVLEEAEPTGPVQGRRRAWQVIPLENLVARGGRLLVPVSSLEDIDLALGVLEAGVAGVVIAVRRPEELREFLARVKLVAERQLLQEATIEKVRPAGMGDRVCIDTCTLMTAGQGILVGNASGFLFLVQAEVKHNPYVAPRPFRVNAGPVHAYTTVPGGRTRYLSELQAGDPVLIVDARGTAQEATVGRSKIERRPLLLIEASCGEGRGSLLLQNAETIRLTGPDGEARSVVDLEAGDRVLVQVNQPGRHFGMKVTETIVEQ